MNAPDPPASRQPPDTDPPPDLYRAIERRRGVSDILLDAVSAPPDDTLPPSPDITIGALVTALGQRGYGLILAMLALPNLFPVFIPGLSVLVGVPILILSVQMVMGRPHPSLPGVLARRSVPRRELARGLMRMRPYLLKLETVLHPRPGILTSLKAQRWIGAGCIGTSLFLLIPLPFTNFAPAAAIAVLGLGVAERDGRTIAVGFLITTVAFFTTFALLFIYAEALEAGLTWIFGA